LNIKIGAKIKKLRKQNDITQEKLAEALSVTGQAVSRWENEIGYPDIEYIVPIAKYFNVTTDFLFNHAADRLMRRQDDMASLLEVDRIRLCFGYGLVPFIKQDGELVERVVKIRRNIALDLGVIIPEVRLMDDIKLDHYQYSLFIKGVEVATDVINSDIDLDKDIVSDKIATHLLKVILNHLHELVSRQDIRKLINNIAESHPILIDELIPRHMNIGDIQKILIKLLKENVPIRDIVSILETLANYAPITKDTDMLTEYVRSGLSRVISKRNFHEGENFVITLAPELEKTLIESIQKTEVGSFIKIGSELSRQIFKNLKNEINKFASLEDAPIVLTSPFVRAYFKQLVEEAEPNLIVISYGEIERSVNIMAVGEVC